MTFQVKSIQLLKTILVFSFEIFHPEYKDRQKKGRTKADSVNCRPKPNCYGRKYQKQTLMFEDSSLGSTNHFNSNRCLLSVNVHRRGTAMKKTLSGLGILFMLVLKHPPMPQVSIFRKISIVQVRGFSVKQIALQFFIN
jgi:hypothetical protein